MPGPAVPRGPGVSAVRSPEAAVLGLIVGSALVRLWVAWGAGLCNGESYYFSSARHPSLSYFDHPPLSILLATWSLHLSGEVGPLVLRAPFIAIFAGTTWLLFVLGRRLFGAWPGFYAALLMNLAPVFTLSVGIFLQPDGPLMFFWLACVWCLVHVLLDPAPRHQLLWAAAGAMLGLGLLSKYQALLLVPGVLLYLLSGRDERRWLARPGPYLALGIAALIFSPVIAWNAMHHWISFIWQGTRGLNDPEFGTSFHVTWILINIGGQALELLPWVWLGLVAELGRSFRRSAAPGRRFIAWLAVVPIVLFTAVSSYAVLGRSHFHWGMPGYLLLFLPLGETIDRRLRQHSAAYRWGLGATVAVSILAMTIAVTHEATGWLKDGPPVLATRLQGDNDPTFECIDFTALEGAFAERGLLGQKNIFVFSDWWHRAGKVDYGLKGRLPVFALNWNDPRSFAFFDRTERWLGKDGILVTTKTIEEVRAHYGRYFAHISALGEVAAGRRGRHELTLYLYRCENLLRPYPLPYG